MNILWMMHFWTWTNYEWNLNFSNWYEQRTNKVWIWTLFEHCLNRLWIKYEFCIQTLFMPTLARSTSLSVFSALLRFQFQAWECEQHNNAAWAAGVCKFAIGFSPSLCLSGKPWRRLELECLPPLQVNAELQTVSPPPSLTSLSLSRWVAACGANFARQAGESWQNREEHPDPVSLGRARARASMP